MIESERIIIVAHYLLYGAAHALRDYLLPKKIKALTCLFLPLATQRKVFLTTYKGGKSVSNTTISRDANLGFFDYIIDVFTTIQFVFNQKPYNVFIGCDPLNCLSGLLLKRMGKVKKVIFYSIDFVPIRFQNKLLNTIYHQIEIYCVKHADVVWNVSPRIAEGRETFLHLSAKKYPQVVVPIGIWNDKIKKRTVRQIKKQQMLFLGHVLEKQGVQAVLEALPLIVKKVPQVQFVIAGGGEYLDNLKEQVRKLSLENYVTFTGWITDREKIDDMMSESAIAIATYKPEEEKLYNFTYYADPTKLKDYLGAGLPIILTDISYNATEIAEKNCGILVKYDKKEIAKAILTLLTDLDRLKLYRKNAVTYAKEFDWENIFKKVII